MDHSFNILKSKTLGDIYIIEQDNQIVGVQFNEPKNIMLRDSKLMKITKKQLMEYFKGERVKFNLPLNPQGTDFQKKAWNALLHIPYGKTWSYQQQAKEIKCPKAVRAIGSANGKNPISIIIPCHRVIGKNGTLTGYNGGLHIKQALLKLEKLN